MLAANTRALTESSPVLDSLSTVLRSERARNRQQLATIGLSRHAFKYAAVTRVNDMADLALVTGASSGIGRAYAEALAARGSDLVVVARRQDRLDELAVTLSDVAVDVLAADLATDTGIAAVAEVAATRPLTMLINNAGIAHYMPFADLTPQQAAETWSKPVSEVSSSARLSVLPAWRMASCCKPPPMRSSPSSPANPPSSPRATGTDRRPYYGDSIC
jgi:NAD(P)-dependent dehydrogenase (short-subunit alcohol dehydrogenase family)